VTSDIYKTLWGGCHRAMVRLGAAERKRGEEALRRGRAVKVDPMKLMLRLP
jgi:hypothetical protein